MKENPVFADTNIFTPGQVLRSSRFSSVAAESTPEAREYWERGYLRLRGLFTPGEIEAWSGECDRILGCDFVRHENIRTPFRMNSGDYPERIDPIVDVSPLFAALARDNRILRHIEAIFRDQALLFKDKLLFKAPGTEGYTMHQDQAYWQLCPADDILSVSIQIDGATAENGCIELFPGYHGEMITPPGVRTNFREEDLARVDDASGEKIETLPGDVLIFHSLAPHRSGKNVASVFRRSLYLTFSAARDGDFYQQQLANYKKYAIEKGQSYFK